MSGPSGFDRDSAKRDHLPMGGRVDLVMGGAGFVGSALVRALVARGRNVVVVDDLSTGRADLLPDGVELVTADVRAPAAFADRLAAADVVYHLACVNLRRSLHDPFAAHEVNATGTLALLEAARLAGVGRFVHVSSSEVYGTARTVPMAEDHPTEPTTAYGASKLAGEAYARAHHRRYGMPVVVVRPFNAMGPDAHHLGDSGEVIPRFVRAALAGGECTVFGDGTQTRDFTHTRDLAAGIAAAGCTPGIEGRTFNLGSGEEISVGDLAALVIDVVGNPAARVVHAPERSGDVGRLCADATAARRALGFTVTTGLRDTIAEVAARHGAVADRS
jgi:UDP-glucose 4-epimerase